MHIITRATFIHDIDSKSHKMELKSSRNYSINYTSQNHTTSYLWPQGHTYACIHTRMKLISKNQVRIWFDENILQ